MTRTCVITWDGAPLVIVEVNGCFLTSDFLDQYSREYAIDRSKVHLYYLDVLKYDGKFT